MSRLKNKILSRKEYCKPEVTVISLDNMISLVMMTAIPPNPPPRGDATKSNDSFTSPFENKPFG